MLAAEAVVGGGYLIGVDFGEIDDRDEDDCENPDSLVLLFQILIEMRVITCCHWSLFPLLSTPLLLVVVNTSCGADDSESVASTVMIPEEETDDSASPKRLSYSTLLIPSPKS